MADEKVKGGTEGLEGLLDGVFDSPKKPVLKAPVVPEKARPEDQPDKEEEESSLGNAAEAKASDSSELLKVLMGVFLLVGLPLLIYFFKRGVSGFIYASIVHLALAFFGSKTYCFFASIALFLIYIFFIK